MISLDTGVPGEGLATTGDPGPRPPLGDALRRYNLAHGIGLADPSEARSIFNTMLAQGIRGAGAGLESALPVISGGNPALSAIASRLLTPALARLTDQQALPRRVGPAEVVAGTLAGVGSASAALPWEAAAPKPDLSPMIPSFRPLAQLAEAERNVPAFTRVGPNPRSIASVQAEAGIRSPESLAEHARVMNRFSEMERTSKMADQIVPHLKGATLDPVTLRPTTRSGYAVADPATTVPIDAGEELHPQVFRFLSRPDVQEGLRQGRHIGTWIDPETKQGEINLTDLHDDEGAARAMGYARGQKSIGHLGEGGSYRGDVNLDEQLTGPALRIGGKTFSKSFPSTHVHVLGDVEKEFTGGLPAFGPETKAANARYYDALSQATPEDEGFIARDSKGNERYVTRSQAADIHYARTMTKPAVPREGWLTRYESQRRQPGDLHSYDVEQPAPEAPKPAPARGPNEEVAGIARSYRESNNLPDNLPRVKEVDPAAAARMADTYHSLKSQPNDPRVRAAYDQFSRETQAQYQHALNAGIRFEYVDQDPYANSAEMMQDVRENRRLKVLKTSPDQAHPYMTPEQNDMFRAVHDLYGHAAEGHQFGVKGEENAWRVHSSMYSPLARDAMSTETRGQNSWVNFHGDNPSLPVKDRPFAEQKASLWPRELQGEYQRTADLPPPKVGHTRVLRVENEAGQGPYIGGEQGYIERRMGRYGEAADAQRQPAPSAASYSTREGFRFWDNPSGQETARAFPPDAKPQFGFATREHLNKWFNPEELDMLRESGFHVAHYDVPTEDVRHMSKQLAFDPARAQRVGTRVSRAGLLGRGDPMMSSVKPSPWDAALSAPLPKEDVTPLATSLAHHITPDATQESWMRNVRNNEPGISRLLDAQPKLAAKMFKTALKHQSFVGRLRPFEELQRMASSPEGEAIGPWYRNFLPTLREHGLPERDADVFNRFGSILSAQKSPKDEMLRTLRAFDSWAHDEPITTKKTGATRARVQQLQRAANDERWGQDAFKTSDYYLLRRGLEGESSALDRHVMRAYTGKDKVTPAQYGVLKGRVLQDARRAGMTTGEWQARIWGGQTGYEAGFGNPGAAPEDWLAYHLASPEFDRLIKRYPGLAELRTQGRHAREALEP